jgi:hypothetical protein
MLAENTRPAPIAFVIARSLRSWFSMFALAKHPNGLMIQNADYGSGGQVVDWK